MRQKWSLACGSASNQQRAKAACAGVAWSLMQGMWWVILYPDNLLMPLSTLSLCVMQHWGAIECYGVRE